MSVPAALPAVRFWLFAVALLSFGAGTALGLGLRASFAAAKVDDSDEYARDLARRYGLSREQQRRLRMVLEEDERLMIQIFMEADWDQMPEEMRNKRLAYKRRTEQRIRFVLDEEQRARYDRDIRPQGAEPGASAASAPENR